MSKRLSWEKANLYGKLFRNRNYPVVTEVAINEEFWRRWREDKEEMRAEGYFVKKLQDGWHAYWRTDVCQ